jgi:hypothetical protein
MGHEMVCSKIWRYCDEAERQDFADTIFWSVPEWTEENLEKMFGIYNSFCIIDTEL